MDKELRLAFSILKKQSINPGEVFSLLHTIGADFTIKEQQAIVDAYDLGGPFNCEEFLGIAESLKFTETAEGKVLEALESIAIKDRINIPHLRQMLIAAGSRLGLTPIEAQEVLRFQLGHRALAKPQVSVKEALNLLN